jgi:ribose/xylose/arabinose/galactoside ABC-type transport system permease subunit
MFPKRIFEGYGLMIFCALLIGVTAIVSPSFRSPNNIQNVLTAAAPLGIVVIGQVLVILVRGFDLSMASVMATAAVIATEFDQSTNWSILSVAAVTLAMCLCVGLANGLLITKRGMSPFLATLATMIVLQGLRFAWTHGAASGRVPDGLRFVGTGQLFGIPVNILLLLFLAAVFWFMLRRTAFGRRIYLVGGSTRGAELVGINVGRIVVACYVLSAVLAGIGGIVLVGYVDGVDNWVGRGYELDSIVAAVMGGVALTGGRGSVLGGLVGALLLTVIFNIVLLLGLPVQFQFVVKGAVIIIAMAMLRLGAKGE